MASPEMDEKVHTVVDDQSSDDHVMDEKHVDRERVASVAEGVHHLAEQAGDKITGLAPEGDIEFVMDKIAILTVPECRRLLTELLDKTTHDYNFPETLRHKLENLMAGPLEGQSEDDWELELKTETAINRFYSPYPEVRAVTTPTDDPTMPCETFRSYFLGLFWACICQFVNSLFNSRFPQIIVTSAVMQVLLYPCGMLLALILPKKQFTLFGHRCSFNPGPWSYKEQILSTLMVNVSYTSAYVFWNIQTQEVYYKEAWLTSGYKILLLLSTQTMGLGFAGLLRRFCVYPQETLWPSILPTVALNRALLVPGVPGERVHGWTISRYKLFWIVFWGMFAYYWLPGYLFPALSLFAWMTYIAPNNFKLATITGSQFGMGFNPISSFDWNVFGTYWPPLSTPFWAFTQQYMGMVIGGLAIIAIYFTNTKWTGYLPINSSAIFDNTGARYNISKIMDGGVVDQAKLEAYSVPFYSAANLVLYSAFFLFYPLTMTFVCLDSWRPLLRAYSQSGTAIAKSTRQMTASIKNAFVSLAHGELKSFARNLGGAFNSEGSVYDGFDDPIINLLKKYPEVPDSWFFMVTFIAFIFSILVLTVWPQQDTPVWTIFFVLGLNLVFLIPMSYLYAISGSTEGLNVLTELVIGYALPGHPNALMFAKAFGYNINGQADTFLSDQKMGYYAKVPPRAMFRGQILSAVITCFVAFGAVTFVDTSISGICTPGQPADFNCAAGSQIYYSASVVWGAIGPKRIFGQLYPELKYSFLVGFLLALLWWSVKNFGYLVRNAVANTLPAAVFTPIDWVFFRPIAALKRVHPSLIINGFLYWAPANLTYFTSGLYLSFGFMYYLRRYKTAWFEKYTYLIAAGLTGGVAFSAVIIFFAVQFHPVSVSWWGTDVLATGVDGGGAEQTALIMDLPERGFFGPATWH